MKIDNTTDIRYETYAGTGRTLQEAISNALIDYSPLNTHDNFYTVIIKILSTEVTTVEVRTNGHGTEDRRNKTDYQ